MSTSSLRELNREIELLIDRGQNNEAIFHCMNILHTFPKCIDTYRNLGKALLESKRYSEASDIFSKILTVLPDDFVSHVGLSIIQEDQRDLDSSIWHMEQAFDSQPSNLALQEELRRLLGRRDGVPPTKVRLSRGALVRMYARGELYQQAIAEIQASLKGDENRLDLQTLLARMYHLSGSNVEAAEVSSKILQKYPYCFEANKILFDLLPTAEGNANEIYKQRLIELDPYFNFISLKGMPTTDIPSEKVIVEKIEYTPSSSEEGAIPDWAKLIGIDWKNGGSQSSAASSDSRSLADILSEDIGTTSTSSPVNPFLDADISTPEPGMDSSKGIPSEEPLPDWISKAGWTRSEELSQPQSFQENTQEEEGIIEDAAPADAIPDWLKSLNLDDNSEIPVGQNLSMQNNFEEQPASPEIPVFPDQISSSDDLKESISNWGNQIEDTSNLTNDDSPQPDEWTNRLINEIPEGNSSKPDELPDWLKNFELDNETSNPNIDNIADWSPSSIQDENPIFSSDQIEPEIKEFEPQDFSAPTDETIIEPETLPVFDIDAELPGAISLPELSTIAPPPLQEIPQVESEPLADATADTPTKGGLKLPGWIRNILSPAAPVAPAVAEVVPEITEKVSDEVIVPLVSDLPADQAHKGAISADTKDELLSWLREVNPESDELLSSELQSEVNLEEVPTEQTIAPDLSLESLRSDKNDAEFVTETLAENLNALPDNKDEVNVFDDRLSGLIEEPVENVEANEFDVRFSELLSEPSDERALVSEVEGMPEDNVDENDFTDYSNRLSDLIDEPKDETVSIPEIEGFVTEDLENTEIPETMPEPLSIEDMEVPIEESAAALPGIDELIDTDSQDLSQEPIPSLENIEIPPVTEAEIAIDSQVDEILEVDIPETITEPKDNLLGLLKSDDYSTLDAEINQSISYGTPIETIIESFKEATEEKQDKFEFWQVLGDLFTKSSRYDEAIEHYSKAEKLLLK